MPLDEDCCKDDADPLGYRGRFVDVTKGHARVRGKKERKFDWSDDLEV